MHHRRLRPDVVPDQRRHYGNQHHRGHEHGRNLVRQPPDGRLGALGFLHQLDDLRQRGLAAYPGGFIDNGAVGVQGTGGDLIAFTLAHRHGLTGQHAFINAGGALGNHPVYRQLLARAHPDAIAFLHVFHRNVLLLAIADHPGGLCP